MRAKWLDTSKMMLLISLAAVLLMFVSFQLVRAGILSPSTVNLLSDTATASGLLVVVVGVWLATMALTQSERSANLAERSANLGIAAARQWLVERRKLESQIDYLFFASPWLFSAIRADPSPIDAPSATERSTISVLDAAKSLVSVIGTLRRLRDSLLTYSENHGLLLAMSIMRNSSHSDHEKDTFQSYLSSFNSNESTPTTSYLSNINGWLFAGGSSGSSCVSLSVPVTVRAVTEIICKIDHLEARVPSFDAAFEKSSDPEYDAVTVKEPSATGQGMFNSLSEDMKDIYSHLVVLRACLEREWVFAFPDGTKDVMKLENRIRDLLAESDVDRFVFRTPRSEDTNAGYRFGHALKHLESRGVFGSGPLFDKVIDQDELKENAACSGTPSRIRDLYSLKREIVEK